MICALDGLNQARFETIHGEIENHKCLGKKNSYLIVLQQKKTIIKNTYNKKILQTIGKKIAFPERKIFETFFSTRIAN